MDRKRDRLFFNQESPVSVCLSFMTVDRMSKQFSQISAFVHCSSELDLFVVEGSVHSPGSKKQCQLKAEILTCPQSSEANCTLPSTSFISLAGLPTELQTLVLKQVRGSGWISFSSMRENLSFQVLPVRRVKLAVPLYFLITLLLDFQLWCFTICMSQLPSKSASKISNLTAM